MEECTQKPSTMTTFPSTEMTNQNKRNKNPQDEAREQESPQETQCQPSQGKLCDQYLTVLFVKKTPKSVTQECNANLLTSTKNF